MFASILSITSTDILMYALVLGLVGWVLYREYTLGKVKLNTGDPLVDGLQSLAMQAHDEGLGVFRDLFKLIANNDKAGLITEVTHLTRLMADGGSFAGMSEEFIKNALEAELSDDKKRAELLDFVQKITGLTFSAPVNLAVNAAASLIAPKTT